MFKGSCVHVWHSCALLYQVQVQLAMLLRAFYTFSHAGAFLSAPETQSCRWTCCPMWEECGQQRAGRLLSYFMNFFVLCPSDVFSSKVSHAKNHRRYSSSVEAFPVGTLCLSVAIYLVTPIAFTFLWFKPAMSNWWQRGPQKCYPHYQSARLWRCTADFSF